MKKIVIEGEEFQYEVISVGSEFDYISCTHFYKGTYLHTYKKYLFFGEKITIEKPRCVFTLDFDIESPSYNKKYVKNYIDKALQPYKRLEEIKKGEII